MLRLDSCYLVRVRLEAMRRRVWFRALLSLERGLVDSVIKVFDRPRSLALVRVLVKIIVKVKRAMMSPVERLMEEVGRSLAERISAIALRWGNKGAAEWVEDRGFIKYLTILDMNSILGFRLSESFTGGRS